MKANSFIMDECAMRPFRRFGIDSDNMSVFSPADNPIGYYCPSTTEFTPDLDYKTRWGMKLINSVFSS